MAPPSLKLAALFAGSVLLSYQKQKQKQNESSQSTPRLVNLDTAFYFLASLVLLFLWTFYIYPPFFSPLRHLPKADFGWRHALYRWLYTEPLPPQLKAALHRTPDAPLLRYTGILGREAVLVASTDAARQVLVTGAYDPYVRPEVSRQKLAFLTGRGLLAVEGEEHKVLRRKLQPAFAFRKIKDLSPVFWGKAAEMAELLGGVVDRAAEEGGVGVDGRVVGARVDVMKWAHAATLDVIGVAVWGNDFGALKHEARMADPKAGEEERTAEEEESDAFLTAYAQLHPSPATSAVSAFLAQISLVIPITLLSRLPLKRTEELKTAVTAVRARCADGVRQRRAEKDVEGRTDILSVAMGSGAFDDAALVDHMMTMLAAGHDTSSISLTWTCYQLSFHPEMQNRLRAEIRTHLPSPSSTTETPPIDSSTLESLPYLQAITNEILRLWPSIHTIRRTATRPTTLLSTLIPASTILTFTALVTNTQPSAWGPDADAFDPERWMVPGQEASGGAASHFDFQTFSQGPRACTGQGFARAELLALVAGVFGRFEVGLEGEGWRPRVDFGITMVPRGGMPLVVRRVPGW